MNRMITLSIQHQLLSPSLLPPNIILLSSVRNNRNISLLEKEKLAKLIPGQTSIFLPTHTFYIEVQH